VFQSFQRIQCAEFPEKSLCSVSREFTVQNFQNFHTQMLKDLHTERVGGKVLKDFLNTMLKCLLHLSIYLS
jgi:hypothetical protein